MSRPPIQQGLALRSDHLATNRRMIIGRSVAAATVGVLPIPLVEDWLVSRIRRGTIRRIALSRDVDISPDAVRIVADGPSEPPSWGGIAGATLLIRSLARSWRKLLIAYVTVQRARAAAHDFTIATLFDHYCARLHVGLGLDERAAEQVRAAIDMTMELTPGGLLTPVFQRGFNASLRATVRAPFELADLVTRGAVRRMLQSGDEVQAIAEVDDAIDKAMMEERGVLQRAVAAVETQVSAEGNSYLQHLLEGFDRSWPSFGPGKTE